jgi:hypothetical protein
MKAIYVLVTALALGSLSLYAQEKQAQDEPAQVRPVIVVHAFTSPAGVTWPYDMKQMQSLATAELRAKAGNRFEVVTDVPTTNHGRIYTLDGEITAWHAGNRAQRVLLGFGTGRESADIHYWLTDDTDNKVIEYRDTIRAEYFGNQYAGSVGELAHPFGDKIASRLNGAKWNGPPVRRGTQ